MEHFNVIEETGTCILSRSVNLATNPPPNKLEAALGHCVVITVGTRVHDAEQDVNPQDLLPVITCELIALSRKR